MKWQHWRWVAIPLVAVLAVVHAFIANAYDEWVIGPVTVLLIFFATVTPDPRRERELRIWERRYAKRLRVDVTAGYREAPKKQVVLDAPSPKRRVKKVAQLPVELTGVANQAGLGKSLARFELRPGIAYLSVVAASARDSSNHQSVVAKLDQPAPLFVVRPLPIVDGARMPNTGVAFKHADFMEKFLVEGLDRDAIKKWLTKPVRDILCGAPDVWLRVERRALALTLYGRLDADQLDDLIATADVLFAEYGSDGGPSLFGDDEDDDELPAAEEPRKKKKKTVKKAAG